MQNIDLTNLEESAAQILGGGFNSTADEQMPTGSLPWDGISMPIRGITHVDDALNKAGLNWRVKQEPIYRAGHPEPIRGRVANIREDTGEFIEIVSNRYKPVQNSQAFNFLEGVLDSGAMQLENAGCFGYDSVFLLARTEGITVLGDKIVPYALIKNSHDGSSGVKVCLTPVRVVCRNTLALALRTAKRVWQAKHLGSIDERMKEAQLMLNLTTKYVEEFPVVAEMMNGINLAEPEIVKVLQKMFPVKPDAGVRAQTAVKEAVAEIMTIYLHKPDLKKFDGTAWGFYNAVGDYVTHHVPKETKGWQESRLNIIANGHPLMEIAQRELMMVHA